MDQKPRYGSRWKFNWTGQPRKIYGAGRLNCRGQVADTSVASEATFVGDERIPGTGYPRKPTAFTAFGQIVKRMMY